MEFPIWQEGLIEDIEVSVVLLCWVFALIIKERKRELARDESWGI